MKTINKDGAFIEMIAIFTPDIQAIAAALRALIAKAHEEAVEVVWLKQKISGYGLGQKKMTEQYCYIAPFKKHVNFGFYRGAALSDPAGLMEGTGEAMRHVKVRSLDDVDQQALKSLLTEAIAERRDALNI